MKTRSFVLLLTVALFAMLPICAEDGSNCRDVAGVLMTDIGAIIPGTINLGPAFGDLGGAVSAQILGQNSDGSFNVQHYWVSSQGDVMKFKQAVLYPVYPIPGNTSVVSVPWGTTSPTSSQAVLENGLTPPVGSPPSGWLTLMNSLS